LVDNSFTVPFAKENTEREDKVPRLPFRIGKMVWFGVPEAIRWVTGNPTSVESDLQTADLWYWDEHGSLVAKLEGFMARRAPKNLFLRSSHLPLYQVNWQPIEFATPAEIPESVVVGEDSALAVGLDLSRTSILKDALASQIILDATGVSDDVIASTHALVEAVLGHLQDWLGAPTSTNPKWL
jgi:hypothetical protein